MVLALVCCKIFLYFSTDEFSLNISYRPLASPTIIDAIHGGAVFMAPSKQFLSMEMHPLFVKSDESFQNLEEQAEEIVSILLDGDREQLPFGGYEGTSYSIEYTCRQLQKIIEESRFRS